MLYDYFVFGQSGVGLPRAPECEIQKVFNINMCFFTQRVNFPIL